MSCCLPSHAPLPCHPLRPSLSDSFPSSTIHTLLTSLSLPLSPFELFPSSFPLGFESSSSAPYLLNTSVKLIHPVIPLHSLRHSNLLPLRKLASYHYPIHAVPPKIQRLVVRLQWCLLLLFRESNCVFQDARERAREARALLWTIRLPYSFFSAFSPFSLFLCYSFPGIPSVHVGLRVKVRA